MGNTETHREREFMGNTKTSNRVYLTLKSQWTDPKSAILESETQ